MVARVLYSRSELSVYLLTLAVILDFETLLGGVHLKRLVSGIHPPPYFLILYSHW